ncbi:M23 family metallopeptidase [Sulfitobacter sp. SK012]|uniref:M23 family metallopeptidase n=1 Tax=Sulfitobacter sp. SK012 TaxID=1389005 RepID=UPI001575E5EC|nr:M23 family metallopeptidase [Sulfitobacter sp. SK012]
MRRGLIAALSLAAPAVAGDLSLISPIDCNLVSDCYIQQYVDHDRSDAASDFTCATLTYNGHKGTDFALPSRARIDEGVSVIASAQGTVLALRDGMPDTGLTPQTAEAVKNSECGNGVVLSHPDGWETQYCHLKQGSIQVTKGQKVAAGAVLGEVGMSGFAEFPHVHLSVRKDGEVIDPFDPDGRISCDTPADSTLWASPPPYRPAGLISLGISGAVPEYQDVKDGTTTPAKSSSSALVVYAYAFGPRSGDTLRLSFSGPEGVVIEKDVALKKDQAQSFRAIGKKRGGSSWPDGTYSGIASLIRNGTPLDTRTISITMP